jgi:hypothetical protein
MILSSGILDLGIEIRDYNREIKAIKRIEIPKAETVLSPYCRRNTLTLPDR